MSDRDLVTSNHARTTCSNGHCVPTVQVLGRGPAFFPRACPQCGGSLPDVYSDAEETRESPYSLSFRRSK